MSVLVVALAIALRVAWVLLVPTKPVGDFAMYVEAAAHLVEHGSLDPEYVYMPGYVFLIAPVQALGGGWLATKLLGAVLGGLGAGAVIGITRQIAGGSRPVALTAGLLYACWPAGIALASVTGTDMPAAVLVVVAAYVLLRFAAHRPLLAAVLFGVLTGLAAYIRAIVVPLAALSLLVFRACGRSWRQSLVRAAVACTVALVVLSPWAVRNRLRYGETFFTDSHGGLTALVGANPNTDGCYSRSLNRMFRDVTGFTLLAEPHRQADRASLAIAKTWMAFDPLFTVGLLVKRAERLLVHERALLSWPLFRAGVLPEPIRGFFGSHQARIESIADGYWLLVLALALFGSAIAFLRRQWLALTLLPQAALLAALYTAIFAAPRYRLPICMLLLPLAALALGWLFETARALRRKTSSAGWQRDAAVALGLVVLVFALAPMAAWAGERLRTHHRFAVHECALAGQVRFCAWRTVKGESALAGEPGLRGVWNGVGIALPPPTAERPAVLEAETELPLPPGNYRLDADIDLAGSPSTDVDGSSLLILANDRPVALPIPLWQLPAAERGEPPLPWRMGFAHAGGTLRLRVRVTLPPQAHRGPPGRLWLSNLRLQPGAVNL
jgi:hypothetical protein